MAKNIWHLMCNVHNGPFLSLPTSKPRPLIMRFFCVLVILLMVGCDSSTDPAFMDKEDTPPAPTGRAVAVTITANEGRVPISPYIYGSSQDIGATDVWTVRRLGGNRMTGYNWENDFSNAGSDYMHSSDTYMLSLFGIGGSNSGSNTAPARVVTHFHDQSLAMGAESIITLQLAGYVSADQQGAVGTGQVAPSSRWVQIVTQKDTPLETTPDLSDDVVYMDELIHFLKDKYGAASSGSGIRWYALDNEPGLWAETHPRIHPDPVRAAELVDQSIALALAVKTIDPDAKIVGPALYGFAAYETLQGAPDWEQEKTGRWFIDYYLDRMREAEITYGQRLLDVLDIHWYPEATGDHRIVAHNATTEKDVQARLQAPRTLWDPSYIEDSWIGQWKQDFLPLIPSIQASIDTYYPGTQLGITEYNYGASNDISGGIAQADVLGLFGTLSLDLATLWLLNDQNAYLSAAFNIYRNYDGAGATFGATSIDVGLADKELNSVYASIHGDDASQMHIIALNKHLTEAADFTFDIASDAAFSEAEVWMYDASSPQIRSLASQNIDAGNKLLYSVPPMTVMHFVLK